MFNVFKSSKNEIALALNEFRGAFRTVGVFSAIINMMMLVPSLYMLQVYDRVLTSRNETTLLMLTIIMLGLLAFEALLEFVRSRVLGRASVALDVKLSSRVFDASFERYLQGRCGSAGQALVDLTNVRQFLTSQG